MMAHGPVPVPVPARPLYCRPMNALRPTAVLLLFCLLLAGCGQKGRLYLPEEPQQTPSSSSSG